MTVPTYADIVEGSLTGLTNIHVQSGSIHRSPAMADITGADDTARMAKAGRHWPIVSANGVYTSATNTFPDPLGGSPACSIFADIQYARITRTIRLKPVHGASAPINEGWFRPDNIPTYDVSINGALRNPEDPLEQGTTTISSLTLPINSNVAAFGASAGVVRRVAYYVDYENPDVTMATVSIRISGLPTISGTTNNPFYYTTTSPSYTAVLIVDNKSGTVDPISHWSGTLLPESLSCIINYRSALPALLQVNGPYHGPVTINNTLPA